MSAAAPSAQQAASNTPPNPDCTITVPTDPLSAKGLATPYVLNATNRQNGPCDEANPAQSAFVEATILDPATGAVSIYHPLVIDKGAQPAAAEVVPTLPKNAVVGISFGFNGNNLTLHSHGNSLAHGQCVNGAHNSIFTQVAYCNTPALFAAANTAIQKGQLKLPALGTGKDGLPCMTTRDFGLVDQDQSDNVITTYLVTTNGAVAQNNTANLAAMKQATVLANGSDNLLIDKFVDPAVGCAAPTAPDLSNPGQQTSSLALDELFAAARQAAPIALVPMNDPMTEVNGNFNVTKTNLYRVGADMPPVDAATDTPAAYCQKLLTVGAQRIQADRKFTVKAPSPDTGAANNLFTFLAQRWSGSLTNLNCASLIDIGDPIRLVTNQSGVVVNAYFPKKK
jgi:hypothetical protein